MLKSTVGFNPCFNGTMYKNISGGICTEFLQDVSILVLMELCIKTLVYCWRRKDRKSFNPCFNGTMYKNR